ncbi:hypothetical protein OJAV_G00033270 [Oryzias javanicus]|uniref:DEP domain-containing protein n=1 Tax=Oryzias javanicus TaxID=123683 RepID=A0A3S2Q8J9_ORYJA|nr:hypothetical protein OJAV_G00033270 [Oryzias javanicus]
MSSHIITPGPYRATKLWNEVTRLFRAGMPIKKHRQNFRVYACCFTASSAVDWLHEMLRCNSNFGPDVTRQQTVQLLKKFLKNHVIEDVKGRWGTEDLEDNHILYRFPSTSPLKPVPCLAPAPVSSSMRRRPSLRDKEGFFKFKSIKKHDKESLENVDPALQADPGGQSQLADEHKLQRRELTMEDEQEIWRDITLTHLQRILGVVSLSEVLDPRCISPQNIIHNMTKVNKHGVVALDDKTNDLPHWVLSAMKSLANWPKYDSEQPSYPGFERDVFKTVSDYFYSLPHPLLTFELYELFINVLVFCGYITAPNKLQQGKRKNSDFPSAAPPAKSSFRSTECLLLSLLKQGSCDETESPMREVIGGKLQSRLEAEKAGSRFGGSCTSLSTVVSGRPKTRSFSLETILDDSASLTRQQLFQSNSSLASCSHSDVCRDDTTTRDNPSILTSDLRSKTFKQENGLLGFSSTSQRLRSLRPQSVGSCLDIAIQSGEEKVNQIRRQGRSTSCLNVNAPASHSSLASHRPSSFLPSTTKLHPFGPRPASSTSNMRMLPAPAVVRRCQSSMDVSKPSRPISLFKPPVFAPDRNYQPPQTKSEHSVLQPHCERVAIEALQLCTLLPPSCISEEAAASHEDGVSHQPERGHASSPPCNRHPHADGSHIFRLYTKQCRRV